MKSSRIIFIIIAAGLFTASCGLLYNPDFVDKVGVGNSGAQFTGAEGVVIGPGAGNMTGTLKSYLKTGDMTASIDGSNYTANYKYPDWTIQLNSLPCGPHAVTLTLKGAGGNIAETKSFTYNVPAYVATTGNDGNAGNSPASPFLSLQKGVDTFTNRSATCYVYVAEGTYTPGNGLNSGNHGVNMYTSGGTIYYYISISGGWKNNFQNKGGISILDGQNPSAGYRVVNIYNCIYVSLQGFTIRNYNYGVYIRGANNTVSDAIIEYNSVGMYLQGSSNNINAIIRYNTNINSEAGAGMKVYLAYYCVISGLIVSNSSLNTNGGGMYFESSYNNTINATISLNNADLDGGGVYSLYGISNIFSGDIKNNSAGRSGGGIYINDGSSYIMNSSVNNNSAVNSGTGGGVYIRNGSSNIINGNISNNQSQTAAGIYIYYSLFNTINSLIANNSAENSAGGIYLLGGIGNNISSQIISNRANNSSGGGLTINMSTNYIVSGSIIGNFTDTDGGGLKIVSGSGMISNCQIIRNQAANGNGSALNVVNLVNPVDKLNIINSIMTNNLITGGDQAVISLTSCTNMRGLMISNCIIGGSAGTLYGIYEDSDITNHILVDNKFIQSSMTSLYYDAINGSINNINNLNNISFTGAAVANGNNVQ